MAGVLGVSPSTVANWERGKGDVPGTRMLLLGQLYCIDLNALSARLYGPEGE